MRDSDETARPFDEIAVGMTITGRARTVTEADVVAFANLTWDHHPAHTDSEWAAAGIFGERVAHGMLVLSFALGLLPLSPEHVAALRRIDGATFRSPVRLGDTIRVEGKVSRTTPLDDDLGLVRLKMRVLAGERLAMTADLDALWRRTPAAVLEAVR
jgi:acyl dehydratase